jgi:Domain of unknown function (DUF305)
MSGKLEQGGGKSSARDGLLCPEVTMVLFSRSFVRKRVISMATTASVAATSFALAPDSPKRHHMRSVMPIQYVAYRPDRQEEQPFLSENDAAMKKMMAEMMFKPSGDVDRDFVEMMVPHRQGAVDMAQAELKYGHNEQLRQLAQRIVATRQREIAVMRLALGELPPSAASSTQPGSAPSSQQGASSSSMGPHDAMVRHSMNMNQCGT